MNERRRIGLAAAACASAVSLTALPWPQALYGALLACAVARIVAADVTERVVPYVEVAALFTGGMLVRVLDASARTTFLDNSDTWSRLGDALLTAAVLIAILLTIVWIFRAVTGRDGLGMGDVQLLAAWCPWLPLLSIVDAITVAAVASIATMLVARRFKWRAFADARFPFAAVLAPALWLVWLFAEHARLAG